MGTRVPLFYFSTIKIPKQILLVPMSLDFLDTNYPRPPIDYNSKVLLPDSIDVISKTLAVI